MTANKFCFSINGSVYELDLTRGALNLSSFLREKVHLKGTKIVCAEGDCGACAVLIDRVGQGNYEVVNSCILPLLLVEGSHILTIEGLTEKFPDHPMKKALLESMGSQCGFCTPGFMVTLAKLYETSLQRPRSPEKKDLRLGCSGHLCRCTGYQDILNGAVEAVHRGENIPSLAEAFPEARKKIFHRPKKDLLYKEGPEVLALPTSLEIACRWKTEMPHLQMVGGATDLGVESNKREEFSHSWMSLKNIPELHHIEKQKDGSFYLGANATLTNIRRSIKREHPEFAEFLLTFASPNIRHAATLVGNLVTASPIGDSLPYLVLNGATVLLGSVRGIRKVAISEFLTGYRKTCLAADEIVVAIVLSPRPVGMKMKLQKVSKREHMDISTLSMAVRGRVEDGCLQDFACVFGGMAATVQRPFALEQEWNGCAIDTLLDKPIDLSRYYQPVSDHRGSHRYRLTVAENLLRDFFETLKESCSVPMMTHEGGAQ